jgi:hypothetical protein
MSYSVSVALTLKIDNSHTHSPVTMMAVLFTSRSYPMPFSPSTPEDSPKHTVLAELLAFSFWLCFIRKTHYQKKKGRRRGRSMVFLTCHRWAAVLTVFVCLLVATSPERQVFCMATAFTEGR